MKYTAEGDKVTLEMTRKEWENLLFALGVTADVALRHHDAQTYWRWIALVDRMNATNPDWEPHVIPEQYR